MGRPRVILRTALGDIRLELYPEQAPVTAQNFLRYVDAGLYEGASFYRVVREGNQPNDAFKIAVIQGGLGMEPDERRFEPIPHETTRTTGLRHQDGTLSMSRLAPGTAHSEIFICLGNQPDLDYGGRRNPDAQGFAAFGRVVGGMAVVQAVHAAPAEGQRLEPPIKMRAERR